MDERKDRTLELDFERERMVQSFRFRTNLVDKSVRVVLVLSSGVPGYFLWKIAEALSGTTTSISVSVVGQVAATASVGLLDWLFSLRRKVKRQSEELVRCRNRSKELEIELKELRAKRGENQ